MKKKLIILPLLAIVIAGIGFLSCNRNKCEEMMVGRLVVLEKPYECQNWCNGQYYKVVAHLVINDDISDSLILETPTDSAFNYYPHYNICGSIPKEYRNPGIYNVSTSLKAVHWCFHNNEARIPEGVDSMGHWYFYKLCCVDKNQ